MTKLTPFQQELLDAAYKWCQCVGEYYVTGGHSPRAGCSIRQEDREEAKDKFLQLLERAIDKDEIETESIRTNIDMILLCPTCNNTWKCLTSAESIDKIQNKECFECSIRKHNQ